MPLATPVKIDFGVDGNLALDKYVFSNLTALINSYSNLHKNKLPEWRRLTKGVPRDKVRNFPWENASNVVIQLIGENVSTIKAVQLGTIYEIMPLWPVGLVGEWEDNDEGEKQRLLWQSFLDLMGLTRTELDLYRVESMAAHDIASLGSVLIKLPWQNIVQQNVISVNEAGSYTEEEIELYDGPRPEKLAFEDWGATPTAPTWELANFKYHEYRLTKDQCEEKVYKGHFDKTAWTAMENSPDIIGLTEEEQKKVAEQNIDTPMYEADMARWCFYECWFKFRHNNKTYSCIYTMHLNPQYRMNAIFNFYPKAEEPFEFGRLGYDDDGLIGYGFAEMGEMYQEDVSTKHNQRNDNHTLCNTSVVLAGNNPRVDSGIALFPMAVLPFHKDDISIEQLGVPDQSSVQEEELTIALAKARFGTDMLSAEGNGSGGVDRKGNYSSMGSFSIMQQGARRININITDFRYLHLNLGQKFSRQYAFFGIGNDRAKLFGKEASLLLKAAAAIKSGRMELPVRAATASINREIEKQTGMLFVNVMQRHYATIAQVLQGATNTVVPDVYKEYLINSVTAMSFIMSKLLRAFGYDDINKLQPELKIVGKLKGASNGQSTVSTDEGTTSSGDGRPGVQEVSGTQNSNTPTFAAPGPQNSQRVPII